MTGQWRGSNRRGRLPSDWQARRRQALAACGNRCTATDANTGLRCARPATEIDHVQRGDDHDPCNLRGLCAWHHSSKSGSEGGTASAASRPSRLREAERHPFDD